MPFLYRFSYLFSFSFFNAFQRGSTGSSSPEILSLAALCALSNVSISGLHMPSGCVCFNGMVSAIHSYIYHARLIVPSASGTTMRFSVPCHRDIDRRE